MAEAQEGLWMSARERDRLKVLHEVGKRHITQKQAGVELGLSARWVRTLLKRLRREGDRALRHRPLERAGGQAHAVWLSAIDGCASPKFCRAVKSTACEISSPRSPAITLVHVPLVLSLVRNARSHLSFSPRSPAITLVHVPLVLSLVRNARSHFSFTPELTPGKFGPPAAPHRAEAQAPQTQAPHARHTFLGGHPPILVWVETISHRRDSGNRGSLA